MNTRYLRTAAIPILVVSLIIGLLWMQNSATTKQTNNYPKLFEQIDDGDVKTVEFDPKTNSLAVTPSKGAKFTKYTLGYVTESDVDSVKDKLKDKFKDKTKDNVAVELDLRAVHQD